MFTSDKIDKNYIGRLYNYDSLIQYKYDIMKPNESFGLIKTNIIDEDANNIKSKPWAKVIIIPNNSDYQKTSKTSELDMKIIEHILFKKINLKIL